MPAGFEPAILARTGGKPRLRPRGEVPRKNNKKKFHNPDSRKSHTLKCHHRFIQNQFHTLKCHHWFIQNQFQFTSSKHNFFRVEFDIVRTEQTVDVVHGLQIGRPRSGGSMDCKDKRFKYSPNFPERVEPIHTLIRFESGSLSLGSKRLERESDHSPRVMSMLRMSGAISPHPTPQMNHEVVTKPYSSNKMHTESHTPVTDNWSASSSVHSGSRVLLEKLTLLQLIKTFSRYLWNP
jgi:hypothetical protein